VSLAQLAASADAAPAVRSSAAALHGGDLLVLVREEEAEEERCANTVRGWRRRVTRLQRNEQQRPAQRRATPQRTQGPSSPLTPHPSPPHPTPPHPRAIPPQLQVVWSPPEADPSGAIVPGGYTVTAADGRSRANVVGTRRWRWRCTAALRATLRYTMPRCIAPLA
jgi:hypothetical protein